MLGLLILQRFEADDLQLEATRARETAGIFSVAVEKVMEGSLIATRSLAVMVYQGKGEVPEFSSLASFLLPLYKGAYAVSLAPEGVIRQIKPLDNNLLARDHDLFKMQDRSAVIASLDPNALDITFMGPFNLVQGPLGAIGMLPVFLDDPGGQPRFWGYTVVTLVLPEALENANLPAIEAQGYAYALTGIDPVTGERRVIQRSAAPLSAPQCRDVHVRSTTWQLCVAPLAAPQGSARSVFDIVLVLVGSVMPAWLIYTLLRLRKNRRELQAQAFIDPLTGLANRRFMLAQLEQALALTRRERSCLAVALLDLDGFKAINDQLGHAEGDQVLINVARRLKQEVRVSDLVARLGGDEYVLVMSRVASRAQCEAVLARVVQAIAAPLELASGTVEVRASIGAMLYRGEHDTDCSALLKEADEAMYRAKQAGKNCYVLVDDRASPGPP
ncbi:hypothetical protein BVH03_14455 [Pseudomonas sp. PA15(2017)]|nr:hypothetical protein BVH03_14455 [Pseudomonas sp. PA15(2017)]